MSYLDPKPDYYNLTDDYILQMKSWGDFFYKIYETKRNFTDAQDQCKSYGAYLAYPRSEEENTFINDLTQNQTFWIGINDIDIEGNYVTDDGRDLVFQKWRDGQPNNDTDEISGIDEDGVIMNYTDKDKGLWGDVRTNAFFKFICFYRIHCKLIFGMNIKLNIKR